MTKIIEGDLILKAYYEVDDDLVVKGDISGKNGVKYNINAWNIDARNINAGDIDYYAVCFAYQNIKCKSIKGIRDNCKHFVLDGTIAIKEKPKDD